MASNEPKVLSIDNDDTITNSCDTINTFNCLFASIAETTKKALNIHKNIFQTILGMKMVVQYFCNLLIKNKSDIISSLNSNKVSSPNSMPYRVLFLLKNEISKRLSDLFSLSFMTGVFPSILKNGKVAPVFKKESKLDYSNYCPIFMLANIGKILEKIIFKRFYTFFNNNVIYNLQFGFRQQYFASHALKNVNENIRKALNDANIGCGVFVDL